MAQIKYFPGGSGTVGTGSGQKIGAFNNITGFGLRVVAQANPMRQAITFHNPGTVGLYIAPLNVQNNGSDATLSPDVNNLGGCFLLLPGGTITLTGSCQRQWRAFASSGTVNPLTVMETNI